MEFGNHRQYNNPNYSYDQSSIVAIAMDPLPPPDKEEQEIVNIMVKEKHGSFHGGVVYFFRKGIEPNSVTGQENVTATAELSHSSVPINPGPNRLVESWKRWAVSTCQAFKRRNRAAPGAPSQSWLQSIHTKLKDTFWILRPLTGQRWVVEVSTQYVNRKGEKVTDTTESEFLSKEMAEDYASQWDNINEQVRLGGDRAPYSIKIFTKTYGQPTPAEAAMQDQENSATEETTSIQVLSL